MKSDVLHGFGTNLRRRVETTRMFNPNAQASGRSQENYYLVPRGGAALTVKIY